MSHADLVLGVYYEHPTWFAPLFAELETRGVPYRALRPEEVTFDPGRRPEGLGLLLNRMSASSFLRGDARRLQFTLHYLEHLEWHGVPVVNGSEAYRTEVSKARQLELFRRCGLAHPETRVVNRPEAVPEAAGSLPFPVIVKPNVGGAGAGVARYDTLEAVENAVARGNVEPGVDGTLLIQEYIPPKDGRITRVEVLGDGFLYAIRVPVGESDFNLCPAEICAVDENDGRSGGNEPVEACTPPDGVIRSVLQVAKAAGVEVGGMEYVEDARDGRLHFYDINALSNFVANAEAVVGFDPWAHLVDWLTARLQERETPWPAAADPV